MSSRKEKQRIATAPKSFETATAKGYARRYEDLDTSPAFKDLTHRQRSLYGAMRHRYYGKGRTPEKDYKEVEQLRGRDKFYFTLKMAHEDYAIYSTNKCSGMKKDIAALENHGFIKVISEGKNGHKSIFQYSDEWQNWKKPPPI